MKLTTKLGFLMLASLTILLTSCNKEVIEDSALPETETSEQQRIAGGLSPGSIPYSENPKGGLGPHEISWRPYPQIVISTNMYPRTHTVELNSWADVHQHFDVDNKTTQYFDVDYDKYTIIASQMFESHIINSIKPILTRSISNNSYTLYLHRPYTSDAVMYSLDDRTVLVRTPKIPQNTRINTIITYGDRSGEPWKEPTNVQHEEHPKGGLSMNEMPWWPESGVDFINSDYHTIIINSWDDVLQNFGYGDIDYYDYFYGIEHEYTFIACWVNSPFVGSSVTADLAETNNLRYTLRVYRTDLSNVVSPSLDYRTILIRTPKLPQDIQLHTLFFGSSRNPNSIFGNLM